MKWFGGVITGGGVGAFFFFSWVIQMLWNSIVVDHLGLFVKLSYWQSAGLWFLIIILFAWAGIGARARIRRR